MNSLNLRQIDGGNVIKQADFGSNLSFELLDERRRKIPELDGQTATIRLIKSGSIAYQTTKTVADSSVSFKLDKVLEKGVYTLEILVGDYVFPSNHAVKIRVEKTSTDYKPENMVKTDLVELQGKITAIEQREHDVNQKLMTIGQNQVEMTKRIETLESREDHDAIYDDTEIKNRLVALEQKQDNDTIYDDTPIIKRIEKLESKEDSDTIYDDSELVSRVTALENKPDKDTIYDDSDIKRRLTALEQKEDHDTIYNDSDLKHRVTELENRPVVEPYNDTEIKNRLTVLESKQDKDTVYDDTSIKERISALEEKPDNDTIYDDTNLKAQVSELQEKLKSLNTVRRAPTGYTLDRTTTPWTIWFDNGCGMTMPQYGTMASVYGYGQEQNAYNKNLTAFPLPPIIMSVSHGTLTVEKIKTIEGCGDYWSPSITIINPVRDRDDYDWANARFNKASLEYAGDPYYSYKYVRQQYFIRTMYELGIWSGEIVEEFGATKK